MASSPDQPPYWEPLGRRIAAAGVTGVPMGGLMAMPVRDPRYAQLPPANEPRLPWSDRNARD